MNHLKIYRRLLPLVTFQNLEDCKPLASVLIHAGIPQLEIAFRSEYAADAIRIISEIDGIQVGAGTVLTNHQAEEAIAAGASFLISPGFSEDMAKTAIRKNVEYFPGVVTPGEVMKASEYGFQTLKFFPAESYGGLKTIQSLHGPFPNITFIPTGGINLDNYKSYLKQSYIAAVGGSFIIPEEFLNSRNWTGLESYIRSL